MADMRAETIVELQGMFDETMVAVGVGVGSDEGGDRANHEENRIILHQIPDAPGFCGHIQRRVLSIQ